MLLFVLKAKDPLALGKSYSTTCTQPSFHSPFNAMERCCFNRSGSSCLFCRNIRHSMRYRLFDSALRGVQDETVDSNDLLAANVITQLLSFPFLIDISSRGVSLDDCEVQ